MNKMTLIAAAIAGVAATTGAQAAAAYGVDGAVNPARREAQVANVPTGYNDRAVAAVTNPTTREAGYSAALNANRGDAQTRIARFERVSGDAPAVYRQPLR